MYKQTVKPTKYPITLAEAKAFCRITKSVEDSLVQSLIYTAIRLVEEYGLTQIMQATWLLQLDSFPTNNIAELGKGNVVSITSVKYNDANGDEQTMAVDVDYDVDLVSQPAKMFFINTPSLSPNLPYIRITYVVGLTNTEADVPDDIKDAIYLTVRNLYDNRDAAAVALPRGAMAIMDNYRNSLVRR